MDRIRKRKTSPGFRFSSFNKSIALLKQNHSVDTSDDDKEDENDMKDDIKFSINDKILKDMHSSEISEQDTLKLFNEITPENFFINYQFRHGQNTLTHEAALKGKPEVLKKLMEYKPDVNIQNFDGDTPLIYMVKECVTCRPEKSSKDYQGINAEVKKKKFTCEKHFQCLKILMDANTDLEIENRLNMTVLSYATMCYDEKREEYLKKLLCIKEKGQFASGLYKALQSKLDIQFLEELHRIWPNIEDKKLQKFMFRDYTFLQIVCKYGMTKSAERLIDLGVNIHSAPFIKHQPIQLACIFSRPDILKILLEKDENLLFVKTKNERNLIHSTVKNIADSENAYECLKILLKHKNKININEADKHGRTPLHYAVLHDSDAVVVKLLENGAELDLEDNWKQTPLMHISETAFEKYLDNMIYDGKSNYNNNYRRMGSDGRKPSEDVNNFNYIGRRGSIKKKRNKESRTLEFHFCNLFRKINRQSQDQTIFYSFPTEFLCQIRDIKRLRQLIQHPIFSIIIYFKWLHIKIFFFFYFFFYLIFCLLFTFYIYLTNDEHKENSTKNSTLLNTLGYYKTSNITSRESNLIDNIQTTLIFIIPLSILITTFLFLEGLKFIQNKMKYLRDLDNALRLIVVITAILVMICLNTSILSIGCAQIKAISVLIAWMELFIVIGKYPKFSYFVSTFRSASINLLKFLFIHIVLLIGFALAFHTLFRSSTTDETFSNPFNAFFKTIVMLTSEFDAGDIPFNDYAIVSHIIFIFYIFIATIVLVNLMIGIAFKQVNEMEKNPYLYESLAQIYYIKHFEDNFNKNEVIRSILSGFSAIFCCGSMKNANYYKSSNHEKMKLEVSIKGNIIEFDGHLIFETHPKEKVKIKYKDNESDTKWQWNCLAIFRKSNLHYSVIENAQKIVSKRFSKNEELRKETSNLKADLDIIRSELIELRRFIQKTFDKKEQEK